MGALGWLLNLDYAGGGTPFVARQASALFGRRLRADSTLAGAAFAVTFEAARLVADSDLTGAAIAGNSTLGVIRLQGNSTLDGARLVEGV